MSSVRCIPLLGLALLLASPGRAAERLFADPVLAKGKGIEIRQSHVDDAFLSYTAARAAIGQRNPGALEPQLKQQVLEKLIATRLFLARATPADREEGKKIAARLISEGKAKVPTEASYRRQLIAVGTTPEKYEADITEQAIVKAVIDRELKNKQIVTDAEVRKFYDQNPASFEDPAKVRVAHILFATRRIPSGEPLLPREQQAKKALAEKALARAKAGEDFLQLVLEYSDDPGAKDSKGELTFPRKGPVPAEFEAAAFSLDPGQLSSVVRSTLGFHVIKLLEKIPATRTPFEKVADNIRDMLREREVQNQLPAFIEKLKQEAGLEITAQE